MLLTATIYILLGVQKS